MAMQPDCPVSGTVFPEIVTESVPDTRRPDTKPEMWK